MAAMKNATISVKVPMATKDSFDRLCESAGLTVSAVLHSFISYVCRRGRFPDEVCEPDPFYSVENQKWLQKSQASIDTGHVVTKSFEEIESMLENAINNREDE